MKTKMKMVKSREEKSNQITVIIRACDNESAETLMEEIHAVLRSLNRRMEKTVGYEIITVPKPIYSEKEICSIWPEGYAHPQKRP